MEALRRLSGCGAAPTGTAQSLPSSRNMALFRPPRPIPRCSPGSRRNAMETALAQKSCTPCRGGVPPLGRDEADEYRRQAPDWALVDEATRIERTYRFRNFREALGFVEQAGAL